MISGCTSAFSLAQIAPARPALHVRDFVVDQIAAASTSTLIGDIAMLFQLGRARIAGDEIEQPPRVAAQRRIAGEQREVGVNLRGDRVIVAGAEMGVGAQALGFAAHHQAHLGVRLVSR